MGRFDEAVAAYRADPSKNAAACSSYFVKPPMVRLNVIFVPVKRTSSSATYLAEGNAMTGGYVVPSIPAGNYRVSIQQMDPYPKQDLLDFTRRLIALRREHPVLRRRRWFQGHSIRGSVDLGWFKPDGSEMGDDDWDEGAARSVGI